MSDENCPPVTVSAEEPLSKKARLSVDYVPTTTATATSSFLPQIEIRLAKGVAKSTLEEKAELFMSTLKSYNLVKNWKSFGIDSLDEFSPFHGLVVSIAIGCLYTEDGADLADRMPHLSVLKNNIHVYKLNEDGALSQDLSLDGNSDDSTVGSQLWTLPCIEFENIWENLVYDTNLKNQLMSYVYSLVNLSTKGANMKIINVNRLILLLGPPGTGKTSLCRGLAQHLSIRLGNRYPRSVMVEINSHSLFSKWFSESGKLVMKMFDQIDELAEDKKCLVFVLIDEVESLGMSRDTSSSRGDPADSIRAVNALLTQIDRVRRRENVLLLCTSNLERCLDKALLDRADLVRHVGPPSQAALHSILAGCLAELTRIGIVSDNVPLPVPSSADALSSPESLALWEVARQADGLSGRSIRQIPALACSLANQDTISTLECIGLFARAINEKKRRPDLD